MPREWNWFWSKQANVLAYGMALDGNNASTIAKELQKRNYLPEKACWACAYAAVEERKSLNSKRI